MVQVGEELLYSALKIMTAQRSLTIITASETAKKLYSSVAMTAMFCNRHVKQRKSSTGTLHRQLGTPKLSVIT